MLTVEKWIGSFAAALGGLDPRFFVDGIRENAAPVRADSREDSNFLGIKLNESFNAQTTEVASAPTDRVTVRVNRTDEEQMMARLVGRVLGLATGT